MVVLIFVVVPGSALPSRARIWRRHQAGRAVGRTCSATGERSAGCIDSRSGDSARVRSDFRGASAFRRAERQGGCEQRRASCSATQASAWAESCAPAARGQPAASAQVAYRWRPGTTLTGGRSKSSSRSLPERSGCSSNFLVIPVASEFR